MKTRVLYCPAPSMRSYQTGLFHLEACSMMTRMKSLVYRLPGNWEWMWVIPEEEKLSGESITAIPVDSMVCSIPWMDNVGQNRYSFPMSAYCEVLEGFHPDVAIMETAEHVASMRIAQENTGITFPIILNIAYVPFHTWGIPASPDPVFRQVEGYMEADWVTFNDNSERARWFEVYGDRAPFTGERTSIWSTLFDPDDANLIGKDIGKETDPDLPIIFYTGRLSDQRRTLYPELFSALERAAKTYEFKVWIGNPNEAMSWKHIESRVRNFEPHKFGNRTLARNEYLELLWHADIVPILIPNRTAGFCEAGFSANAVISANQWEKNPNTVSVISHPATSDQIFNALGEAIELLESPDRVRKFKAQAKWITEKHGVDATVEEVLVTVESLLG